MTYIKLDGVRAFPNVKPDKAHALKPLEEAAKVFGAWQGLPDGGWAAFALHGQMELMDEIADTIQASCNLAAALGVTDLTPYLARCEERNRRRGRYDE